MGMATWGGRSTSPAGILIPALSGAIRQTGPETSLLSKRGCRSPSSGRVGWRVTGLDVLSLTPCPLMGWNTPRAAQTLCVPESSSP